MKRILIFASGEGKAAEKLVSLFNEGNRVHTDFVITDIDDEDFGKDFAINNVKKIFFNDEIWASRGAELLDMIRGVGADLIVIDGWDRPLPQEFLEITSGRVLVVSPEDNAPLKVVRELEREEEEDRRKNFRNEREAERGPEAERPKSPEEEWAESFHINYDPRHNRNTTPPPIPEDAVSYEQPAERPYEPRGPHHEHRGYRPREHYPNEPMPSTYLIWSVFATILCCFIPGIVAIVFSSQVSSRYYAGDIEGAKRASRNAEIWIIVSFILGILSATLWVPLTIIGN